MEMNAFGKRRSPDSSMLPGIPEICVNL